MTDTATDDAINDSELLALAAKGDRVAFSQIYDRYSKPLYSLAMKMLGESSEAEDVVQDVFIALWNNAGSFDANRAKLFTWAVTLTRNKAIDRIRTRKRRSGIIERSGEDIADFSLSAELPDSVEVAGQNERAHIVRRVFKTLPSEQRKPIELAYFKGLTQVEIAEKLGQPLGTVKARIRRGLLRLRDGLEGQV
ncbi:MAG: sigma-70 family RNA polymerase sigma factor [Opitutaceae bacterium]